VVFLAAEDPGILLAAIEVAAGCALGAKTVGI
jgi:hypothetical protein